MKYIYLDICDYDRNVLCNIYDNSSDVQGQAVDYFMNEERNGWKEITFILPCKINTENGSEDNFRLDYLKADYKIRVTEVQDNVTTRDWYLISELGIKHDKHSKTIEVTAGHVSQLLKYRALSLEFSDDEGNNTGTAEELLTTILKGTGWNVGNVDLFYEKDGTTVKVRSLEASIKTGAFKLIEKLCEKFDARPIYYYEADPDDTNVPPNDIPKVDIVPLNPFSEDYEIGTVPEEVVNDKILEITYGINARNIKRTYNTESIVTKLYAYGAYGDAVTGYCGVDSAMHSEYIFSIPNAKVDAEYGFDDQYGNRYYFTIEGLVSADDVFIWSDFDFLSRSYVWNDTRQYICHVYKKPNQPTKYILINDIEIQSVENVYPFLLNVDYYRNTGLLSDEKFKQIAAWQRNSKQYRDLARNAQGDLLAAQSELSDTAESYTGFLTLAVDRHERDEESGKLRLVIDVTQGDEGVLYRTDYLEQRRKRFSWRVATEMKEDGDPVNTSASLVYIVHDTDPVTYTKAYISIIYSEDGIPYLDENEVPREYDYALDNGYPAAIDVWADYIQQQEGDKYYLFCTNSMTGKLGHLLMTEESVLKTLATKTSEGTLNGVTIKHPVIFSDTAPEITMEGQQVIYDIYYLYDYAWWYRPADEERAFGDLYFMYTWYDDQDWKKINISDHEPEFSLGEYYYDYKTRKMYHGEVVKNVNTWVQMKETAQEQVIRQVSIVIYYCRKRDMLHKGYYEDTLYQAPEGGLHQGHYAFDSGYGFMDVFSTDRFIEEGKYIRYDSLHNVVQQTVVESIERYADAVKVEEKGYESLVFPASNILPDEWSSGRLDENGVEKSGSSYVRTNYVFIHPNATYEFSMPEQTVVFIYNQNKKYVASYTLDELETNTFNTNGAAYYIRIYYYKTNNSQPIADSYIRVQDYEHKVFAEDKMYTVLQNTIGAGDFMSIPYQMQKFRDTAEDVQMYLKAYQDAVKEVENSDLQLTEVMGDAMREGTWQENSYVEGDEEKLYDDAMDNLREMSQPDIDYDIDYLELFGSNKKMNHLDPDDVEWPDVDISFAVHLIDEELDLNQWAYIDKIQKCIDQPKNTKLTINTKLSLIRQHDFKDVMTRIADVANEVKAKQSIYQRAKTISTSGKMSADELTGELNLTKVSLFAGKKNIEVVPEGGFVFTSADGSTATMINGDGLFFATSKDTANSWVWVEANISASATNTEASTEDVFEADEIRTKKLYIWDENNSEYKPILPVTE